MAGSVQVQAGSKQERNVTVSLTPKQREQVLEELQEIDSRLRRINEMLHLICRAKGIDPDEAIREGKSARARRRGSREVP